MLRFVGSGLLVAAALFAADWPQLLGPGRDGLYPDSTQGLTLRSPKLLWKKPVGAGFSGPAVVGGRLILFHRQGDKEVVESLDAKTGVRQWVFEYDTTYKDDFGFDEGPRATPTVVGNRVYTFGAEGTLHGLELGTGKKLWRVDTQSKFSVKKGFFGAAGSPLVENGLVYLNAGGGNGAGVVALDAETGATKWSAVNDHASYSSPVSAVIGGAKCILFFTREGLVAVEPLKGTLKFRYPWRSRTNASVNAALPVVLGDRIFLTSSYNTGAVLLEIRNNVASRVWAGDESLSAHYSTPVLKDGYLYGFHGRQEFGQSFRCVEMNTGRVMWSEERFGAGSVILAGGKLIVLKETGEAVLAAANPKAFRVEASATVLPRVVRSFPALAAGVLYARNENSLVAWQLF
ncbi:MAG: PQQ-binding-like beta-propeller repeat protein [Bryobacteraceae bacterium]|nr:PQQ-binding-like beta-propeller repeat protein [Bryobacteraceae bacterium]